MYTNAEVLVHLDLFNLGSGGLGSWITEDTDAEVLARIGEIETKPISKVQLNQLLAFGHEAPLSDAFFRYYWLEVPVHHPYEVTKIPFYQEAYSTFEAIQSMAHLKWGMYRIYVDGLLYFGNIRSAYRALRALGSASLQSFFKQKCFNTDLIKKRGSALPLKEIAKDDRYLIAEMACKSYGEIGSQGDLRTALFESFNSFKAKGGGAAKIVELLEGVDSPAKYKHRQAEFKFSADEVLEELVSTLGELEDKYKMVAEKFTSARNAALRNTKLYLSTVGDLDVYVATSMRTRKDFREMASSCETIFSDSKLSDLQLRYFDPTLSAAAGHEDKGLIECLMVRCAKALVYCAGERDSYGKDTEAAMALSLGKPVIFYCDQEQRKQFYKDVHPLSRLIEFSSGVAVGAIVTDTLSDVSEVLYRLFENKMEYTLRQHSRTRGHLQLIENLTGSVVRVQTGDQMLSETFWNHYHSKPLAE